MTPVKTSNEKAARLWGSGRSAYEIISQGVGAGIIHGVARLAPQPDEHILDVATGTGRAAREVAFRGATVTAVDIADGLLDAARELHSGPGNVEYRLGDAESLPFDDATFDAAISTYGVMFTADPVTAGNELARVVRPGGRVVVVAWTPESNAMAMRGLAAPYAPPPPDPAPPPPHAWGTEAGARDYLGDGFELAHEHGRFDLHHPDGQAAWRAFAAGFGPVKMVADSLDTAQRDEFARSFVDWCEQFRGGLGLSIPFEYMVTVGKRR